MVYLRTSIGIGIKLEEAVNSNKLLLFLHSKLFLSSNFELPSDQYTSLDQNCVEFKGSPNLKKTQIKIAIMKNSEDNSI